MSLTTSIFILERKCKAMSFTASLKGGGKEGEEGKEEGKKGRRKRGKKGRRERGTEVEKSRKKGGRRI